MNEKIEVLAYERSRTNWRPMSEISTKAPDDLILAKNEEGHVMVWKVDILLNSAMKITTPSHLQFQATSWMEVPK